MTSRRDILRQLADPLVPLYGAREAQSIALLVAAERSGLSESAFRTDPDAACTIEGLEPLIEQLTAGRPVQYVLGAADFYGRRFAVREGVLIPRPETEELVAWVVRESAPTARILDIGTGSGCIAATLAAELPQAAVSALDISDEALAVAAENGRRLGVEVSWMQGDILQYESLAGTGPLDAIVSNPPYVPERDRAAMHPNVRDYEPAEALFVPDDDPLCFYRAIARAGRQWLRTGGKLYFEIYHEAGETLGKLLEAEGYVEICLRQDLFGKDRMLCARMN